MKSLRLVSLLLEYPTAELVQARGELCALAENMNLKAKQRAALRAFIDQRTAGDLMDWQSLYDGLFERGRSLSLLLFEHVHGESRDRGQAMVDLMAQYQQAGLEIDANELPDYLPLYLEFLSTQGPESARAGLQEIEHILALLAARL
jgi:nitrate reductase molybdenum cofactor assembly chaperone NarJ/NarW